MNLHKRLQRRACRFVRLIIFCCDIEVNQKNRVNDVHFQKNGKKNFVLNLYYRYWQ